MQAKDAVEHLVGLQAQDVLPPYYALWSRLRDFDPDELGRLLTEREVVRLWLMRGTVHLVSVDDAVWIKPLTQVVGERQHRGAFGRRTGGAEPREVARVARELLAEGPLSAGELGRRLVEHGIGDDAHATANAVRACVPVVQITPRGVWRRRGQARLATFESWTGRGLDPEASVDELVLRYLRAFGPATVMDMQNWSGLTRLRDAFERLRPQLDAFRDEDGKELFDLPDAPRPGPAVEAPVRLLGMYDNVLLGHADRRRIVPERYPSAAMFSFGRFVNNLLVGGMLRASWWIERDGGRPVLAVRPFGKLSRDERAAVEAEGAAMLGFAAEASGDIRFEDPLG